MTDMDLGISMLVCMHSSGGARGVMVSVVGNGHGDTIAFSHSTNTLGKGMNPIILLPAMGK